MSNKTRCHWVNHNPLMIKYHDTEWGVPLFNDRKLFEFLILEGAQAGLSWETVLNKRAAYKKASDNFDPEKVSRYGKNDIQRLLRNAGIIRNKAKIKSAVNNAKRFLEVKKEFGSFSKYIWRFVGRKPIQHKVKRIKDYPTHSIGSDQLSADLKKRGFSFVGTTIMYAHMQATGMVNDHMTSCFRYSEVKRLGRNIAAK